MKPLKIQSALLQDSDTNQALVVYLEGEKDPLMLYDLKATLLQWGLVPVMEHREYGQTYQLNQGADEEQEPIEVPNVTNDPILVELARRLWAGMLPPGPVEIPTLEEALAARWDIQPQKLRFVKLN